MSDVLRDLALSTLSCSVAIVVVLCVRKTLTRIFGAGAAYALWALVPLASLAVLVPARSVVVVIRTLPASATFATSAIALDDAPIATSFAFERGINVAAACCGLWLLGAFASGLLFAVRHRRFVGRLGTLDELGEGVYRSRATHGCPALVGLWRPKIVVPSDFETRYDAAERELILAHERHHLARGDMQANAFSTLLRSLFWFNPLVHFAARAFVADQELSCDAAVVARLGCGRRRYANAMLKSQLDDLRAAWTCPWGVPNLLRDRIAQLASPSIRRSRRRLGSAVVSVVVASGSIVAWASLPAETRTRYETMRPDATSRRNGEGDGEHALAPTMAVTAPVIAKSDAYDAPVAKADAASRARERRLVSRRQATATDATDEALPNQPTMLAAVAASSVPAPRARILAESASTTAAVADQPPREVEPDRRDHSPKYPAAAVRANIEGRVVLDVGVDDRGRPTDARVATLQPSTASELASASLAAITQWQFEPALRAGHPVAGRIAVPFVFATKGPSAYAAPEDRRQASYRTITSGGPAGDIDGLDGVVYLRVRIEDNGAVSSGAIERIDPPSAARLGASALSSLKQWTFNPARDRGKAAASTVVVPVVFGAGSLPSVAPLRNALDPIRVSPGPG